MFFSYDLAKHLVGPAKHRFHTSAHTCKIKLPTYTYIHGGNRAWPIASEPTVSCVCKAVTATPAPHKQALLPAKKQQREASLGC